MRPLLSILMASYDASATVARALRSLERQSPSPDCEIVVVDSGRDDTAEIVARDFPAARLIRSPRRLYAGEARNLAAAAARGDVLALADADCLYPPDWAARVLAAHAAPHSVIGGVIENGNPERAAGWAYYFAEFHHWLPGQAAGFVDEVPGCSLTMKRAAFDRFGPFLTGGYCSDTRFVWRLAAAGERPWLDPAIRVAHLNPTGWRATLAHEVRHGRDFARLRAREKLSRAGALARAVAAPALPPLLLARAARHAWRQPALRAPFLRATPRLLTLLAAWSAGEGRGYAGALFGGSRGAA